jgi:hypothetical protein
MMRIKNCRLPILAFVLVFAFFGCTLQGDKEEDGFEEVKYDTFKIFVDDVGPVPEQDMTGNLSGRWGMMKDGNVDGRPDSFYQLPKPNAGIVGLIFGDDGYAAGGKAFGMTAFKAGQTHYETPLASLTQWVRDGAVLSIDESKYMGRPDTLLYLDRITGEEMTAPLTGKKEEVVFSALPMGKVTLGLDMTTKSYFTKEDYKDDDFTPQAGEELYGRCIDEPESAGEEDKPDYREVCQMLDEAGMLADYGKVPCAADDQCDSGYSCTQGYCHGGGVFQAEPWGVKRCMQEMFYHNDGAGGTRFNACLMNNCLDSSNVSGCFDKCKVEQLSDENGCSGEYSPEIGDVAYVIKSPAGTYQIQEGGAVISSNSLSVFFDYMDADCNFHTADADWAHIGQVVVEMTEGADGGTTFTLPPGSLELGCNSFEDKKMLGFTFAELSEGTYKFKITLKQYQISTKLLVSAGFAAMNMEAQGAYISQLEKNQKDNDVVTIVCDKSSPSYEGSFVVSNFIGGDNLVANIKNLTFVMHETYVQEIDEYGLGRGFIDVLAADPVYMTELMDLNVAMIQGYIWSVIDADSFPDWDMDTLNSSIFGTTADNRHTKYIDTDDIQASAFYLDQPMTPGLFTFHGNTGWNIYPKAPSGNNSDQPFVLGDFDTDEVYMPMKPFLKVDPRYAGCDFDGDYWGDYLYRQLAEERGFVDGALGRVYSCERIDNLISDYFGSRDKQDFIADAEAYSAYPYWNCRISCLKDTDGGVNGCYTLEDCLDLCPEGDPKAAQKEPFTQCQMPGYERLDLTVEVSVPPAFRGSPKYAHLFNEPDDPLSCFETDALSCSDDGSRLMRCVSGLWVEEANCADTDEVCRPTASSFACDRTQCSRTEECELACSGTRLLECSDGEWAVSDTCEEGYTCHEKQCRKIWEPLRVGLIPISTLMTSGTGGLSTEIVGIPGGFVNYSTNVSRYFIPLPYMPYVTSAAASTIATTDWVTFQMYMAIFDRDGNVYAMSKDPTNTDPDFTLSHLVMWNTNWVGPDMEGWTLAEVEISPGALSLTATVNPATTILSMSFGDLETSGEDNLNPSNVPQWQ